MMNAVLQIESSLGYWGADEIGKFEGTSLTVNISKGAFATKIKDIVELAEQDYVPSKGDKIYFLPGVSVPRVKFKQFALKNEIKSVRNPEDANVFIGSDNTISKISTAQYVYRVPTEVVKEFFQREDVLNALDDDYDREKITSVLEFYDNPWVALDNGLVRTMASLNNKDNLNAYANEYNKLITIKPEYESLYEVLLTKPNVYSEENIIDQLNGTDATVIDDKIYHQLKEMFESTDTENHVLAMEIMANCKYKPSIAYLLLLFYFHGSRQMYQSRTKNHVNFKSLSEWLTENNLNLSHNKCMSILADKGELNKENIDIFVKYAIADLFRGDEHQILRVKTVTLSDEYLADMNMNYTYELRPDFIPVPEEIPEQVVSDEVHAAEPPEGIAELMQEITSDIQEIAQMDEEDIFLSEEEVFPTPEKGPESEDHKQDSPIEAVEATLDTIEPVSNNDQINTNESTPDIDWF